MQWPSASSAKNLEVRADSLYFPALTGIRAIAAYMVYLCHFNPFEEARNKGSFFTSAAYTFVENLNTGVTIFFVLSGFLITIRYADTIIVTSAWFKRYLLNRVARIYPMYFLLTAATFLPIKYDGEHDMMGHYNAFHSRERLVMAFLNFTMLRGFSDNFRFSGVLQGWSLTVEDCFYVSAPFILLGIANRRSRIFWYPLLLLAIGLLLTLIGSKLKLYGFFVNYSLLFHYTYFGRCLEFFMGIGLALLVRNKLSTNQLLSRGYSFTTLGSLSVMLYLAGLAVLATVNAPAYNVLLLPLNSIVLPALLCVFYFGLVTENNSLTRLLGSPLFNLLGKSSYSFYLIHLGVIQVFFISLSHA